MHVALFSKFLAPHFLKFSNNSKIEKKRIISNSGANYPNFCTVQPQNSAHARTGTRKFSCAAGTHKGKNTQVKM